MRLQRDSWRSPKKCIIQQVEERGDEQALSYCHAFVQGLSKQHSLQCWVDEWPIKSLSGILHCRAFLQGLTERRSLQRRWTHLLTSLCHWPVWDSAMLVCRNSESSMASTSKETEATPPLAADVSPSTGSGTNGHRVHPSKPQASCSSTPVHGSNCLHLKSRN